MVVVCVLGGKVEGLSCLFRIQRGLLNEGNSVMGEKEGKVKRHFSSC